MVLRNGVGADLLDRLEAAAQRWGVTLRTYLTVLAIDEIRRAGARPLL